MGPKGRSAGKQSNKPAGEHSELSHRVWIDYAEEKYGIRLAQQECEVELRPLVATQSEIERVKYELVLHDGYRTDEPILVYRGRLGLSYIVDGHTRARVRWDLGERGIQAILLTARNVELDGEFARIAEATGGGTARRIWEVPITDRLGIDSAAWHKRRGDLLRALEKQSGSKGKRTP